LGAFLGLAQDLFKIIEICLDFFWVSPENLRMFQKTMEQFEKKWNILRKIWLLKK